MPPMQLAHVVGHIRARVALRERRRDVVQRAPAVAQLEHVDRGLVQAHGALRDEQQMLAAHVVVLEADAVDEPGAVHGATGGCVSPRSIASSCAHSTSVLNLSAATARSCCSGVRQRSTTSPSA